MNIDAMRAGSNRPEDNDVVIEAGAPRQKRED
jgi:hypothetical protein